MRVIGGQSRGRRLTATLPASVRPTSDRVRESIFDIVGSMGGVAGLDVVDLFSGSGALGIEALSRGAESVTFVDAERGALEANRQNLAAVGLDRAPATFARSRLPQWLDGAPGFDLALCDPPYDFEEWGPLLSRLRAPLAVLESRVAPTVPGQWTVARERRYGSTLVTVVRQTSTHSPAAVLP